MFLKKLYFMLTKAGFIRLKKCSNIVKYYYNFKKPFYIWIYFKK